MLKKWAIFGAVLLTLGLSALVSVYGWKDSFSFKPLLHLLGQGNHLDLVSAQNPQWANPDLSDPNLLNTLSQRSAEEQQRRLQANMHFLIVNAPEDSQLAEALYGENWQAEVEAYKKKLAQQETLSTWSTVLTLLGLITVMTTSLTGLAHGLARQIKQLRAETEDQDEQEDSEEDVEAEAPSEEPAHTTEVVKTSEKPEQRGRLVDPDQPASPPPPRPKVGLDPAAEYRSPESGSIDKPTFRRNYPSVDYGFAHQNFDEEQVENLLSDESSVPPEKRLQQQFALKRPSDNPKAASSVDVQTDLQAQTAALAAQVAELSQQNQSQKQSKDDSEPVNDALKNLSEQISAIRTFAATQQDRVEKLQSGYDWNIIRTFCLRIIRCIDNLESRIITQEEEGQDIDNLTDVRDELIFALESSGVEQYELDINSPFRGQERRAEAVKDKEPCPSEDLKGCIAAVITPGYQYVIDEDNMRVVRMARVKLYD